MESFMGAEGARTMFQITLREASSRSIAAFSLFPQESEVLLPPNVRFEIVSFVDAGHGLTMVQLQQVETTDPLLEFGVLEGTAPQPALTSPVPQIMNRERTEQGLREALASGWTLKQLHAKGYVEGLKTVGITCAEAKAAGYTLDEAKQGGYEAHEAKAAGYEMTIAYAKQWGFVKGLKAAGFPLEDVMEAEYTLPEILIGGYTKEEAGRAGYSGAQLEAAVKLVERNPVWVKAAKERAATEAKAADAARTSQFHGPCKECCMPLACCCVSADGNKVYGCVPTMYDYSLPLCLHTCLCPQQGGSPYPSGHHEWADVEYFMTPLYNNAGCMCIQNGTSHGELVNQSGIQTPHPARPAPASPRAPASCLTILAVAIFVVRAHSTSAAGNGRERRARAHLLETGRRAAPSTARAGGRAHTRPVAAFHRPVPHSSAVESCRVRACVREFLILYFQFRAVRDEAAPMGVVSLVDLMCKAVKSRVEYRLQRVVHGRRNRGLRCY
jgi:hypothetical protein